MKKTAEDNNRISKNSHTAFYAILVLMSWCMAMPVELMAAETAAPASVSKENSAQDSKKALPFSYVVENRRDPFLPFITEKAATSNVNMDEIVEKDTVLSGMQLFEPGQLNLVALLAKGPEQIAMVEDSTGKGYVISKGTKIGKRGVVADIIPNKVLIEETAETRAGNKIITKVVMVLKKEGEE
jgi:Tfp pilus assembly protein PilP